MREEINPIQSSANTELESWREKEIKTLQLIQIIGSLRFEKSIELILFRQGIYNSNISTILQNHEFAFNYINQELPIGVTLELAKSIQNLEQLAPSKVDLGRLGVEWISNNLPLDQMSEFVKNSLKDFINVEPRNAAPRDVVLYGFGRIGRLAARRIINSTGNGNQLRLKAIVIRPKLKDQYAESVKRAALLKSDSVHGEFGGSVKVSEDGSQLLINGNQVQMIYASSPEEVDYTKFGIQNALVIDNTGVWRDRDGLSRHLRPGVAQVLLTAPAKGDVPNIVFGANERTVNFDNENIISAASCTTNAIVPVLKVLQDHYGVDRGHVETIHAYTNDQNLLDNFHKKPRRGRGAPINMVLTTTGAASAVAKVIPELAGKLTGNAIRVPTPNVSLAILSLTLHNQTSIDELNRVLKEATLHGDLVEQIHYSTSTEYVSSNAIGMTSTSVLDAPSNIVSKDGKNITIYLWYDNEYGYTCQVVRLAKFAAKVRRYIYR